MRQYIRIEDRKPIKKAAEDKKTKPRTTDIDFNIAHEDLMDEFTLM